MDTTQTGPIGTTGPSRINCSALIVHGLNDYNVRTKEFQLMYNAFTKAGENVKLLLHQDAHLTPTYPAGNLVFDIGDSSYDEILNRWFSHYLYGVKNGAEDMAVQSSHDTNVWNTYDSWDTASSMIFKANADSETTTINSNYDAIGVTSQNWQSKFTSGSTGGSVMYAQTVEKDTTIKGTVAVNFSALTENTDENGTPIGERDALMVSAMLVDIAPAGKTFPAFNTSGSYVPKTTLAEGGAWMGGGLPNYDLTKLEASDVTYKIISRGWMDLCNPGAGFDSHTADTRVALDGKTYHDYTIYLQSPVYEVEAGHTLALVIYAYEPGMAKYSQNYQITIDNSTVSADIPVNAKRTVSFADVSSDSYCADAVKWAVENGVTNGTTATTFSPNAACTRGQIVTFLWRAAGSPAPKSASNFTDVPADAYYAKAVAWAVENGLAEAVFKMSLGNEIGFAAEKTARDWFAPMPGAIVAELTEEVSDAVRIGATTAEKTISLGSDEASISELLALNDAVLESVYPTKTQSAGAVESLSYEAQERVAPAIKLARPKALIPVFPGTNCEYDTQRALLEAGADAEQFIIRNLTSADVADSVERFAKAVKDSQIIVVPGGFSGGDEPDGSAKLITAFFRSAAVKEQVTDLLDRRGGLMLGICNGFQALIKLGLVPYGKIMDTDADCPTLTYNVIGRHQSRLVRTRVCSNKSPWLTGTKVGDIYTVPISHGEGRFLASEELVKALAANGQIATQYVDLDGCATMNAAFNPNGSLCAIEGITSPDGRVLGKMGHTERIGKNLYRNVPGQYEMELFTSAVRYFK